MLINYYELYHRMGCAQPRAGAEVGLAQHTSSNGTGKHVRQPVRE